MADPFPNQTPSMTGPIENAAAVTPDDATDLPNTTRALWIGGSGDVKLTLRSGDVITLQSVPAGSLLPFRVSRVWAASLTASQIVALW